MNSPVLLYRENNVRCASAVGLVVMLFDTAIEDLYRAINALKAGDVETRTAEIRHALLVFEQLQGSLQMDAGEPAAVLDRFYSILRAKLLEAQMKQSASILQQEIDLLISVRDTWKQVDNPAVAAAHPLIMPPPPAADEMAASAHWSA